MIVLHARPAKARALRRHPVGIVEADQPIAVRAVQRERVAQSMRAFRRRLAPLDLEFQPGVGADGTSQLTAAAPKWLKGTRRTVKPGIGGWVTQRDVPLKLAELFVNRHAVHSDGPRLWPARKFGPGECGLCYERSDRHSECDSDGYHGGRPLANSTSGSTPAGR